jgi:hypothetical protein
MKTLTREQRVNKGLIWQVSPQHNIDLVWYEGTRTQCLKWIKNNCKHEFESGKVSFGKIIWEKEIEETLASGS